MKRITVRSWPHSSSSFTAMLLICPPPFYCPASWTRSTSSSVGCAASAAPAWPCMCPSMAKRRRWSIWPPRTPRAHYRLCRRNGRPTPIARQRPSLNCKMRCICPNPRRGSSASISLPCMARTRWAAWSFSCVAHPAKVNIGASKSAPSPRSASPMIMPVCVRYCAAAIAGRWRKRMSNPARRWIPCGRLCPIY